jgi:intracellular septation protein
MRNQENPVKNNQKKENQTKENLASFFSDYLPLIIFFAFYKLYPSENPLIEATIALIISTIFALIISYILVKKIAKVALFSAIILTFFGSATILLKDEIFIKMKPTIVNIIFAAILFYSYFARKNWLSLLMKNKINMSQEAWLILSKRWAIFFLFLAILNEIIWRNFSTDFWVSFKVIGMTPISLFFTISQIPFMLKEIKKFEQNSNQ